MAVLIDPLIKISKDVDGIADLARSITLRDLFAAAALAGQEAYQDSDRSIGDAAELAYLTADAMLAERERAKQ